MLKTWANGLSLMRLCSTLPCTWAIVDGQWKLALAFYLFAVASDMADGPIARYLNQTSELGGLIDHSCDALFVTICLAGMATTDAITPLLPLLIPLSFIQYVLDSRAIAGAPLRASFLGRWNGIAYFVLLGFLLASMLLDLSDLIAASLGILAWLLVISTVLSMADRAWALLRNTQGAEK